MARMIGAVTGAVTGAVIGAVMGAVVMGLLAAAGASPALAQQAVSTRATPGTTAPAVRLRGTLTAVSAERITLRTRAGEVLELALANNLGINEVYPVQLGEIKSGDFIGVGAMPQADGTQKAIAVTVFPEASRGVGEGHRPFDLAPDSTMTNATVADVTVAAQGRRLQVRFKDGEKIIVVPPGTPIVSFRPGDRGLLQAGASVSLSAAEVAGRPTALRINAGRAGFVVPY